MKQTVSKLRTQLEMGSCRKQQHMRYLCCSFLLICSILSPFAALTQPPLVPWDAPEDNGVLLHSGWQLHDVPSLDFPDIDAAGTQVSEAAYAPSGWMQASVPGTILACMVNNGTFPDPNYAKNCIPGCRSSTTRSASRFMTTTGPGLHGIRPGIGIRRRSLVCIRKSACHMS